MGGPATAGRGGAESGVRLPHLSRRAWAILAALVVAPPAGCIGWNVATVPWPHCWHAASYRSGAEFASEDMVLGAAMVTETGDGGRFLELDAETGVPVQSVHVFFRPSGQAFNAGYRDALLRGRQTGELEASLRGPRAIEWAKANRLPWGRATRLALSSPLHSPPDGRFEVTWCDRRVDPSYPEHETIYIRVADRRRPPREPPLVEWSEMLGRAVSAKGFDGLFSEDGYAFFLRDAEGNVHGIDLTRIHGDYVGVQADLPVGR